MSIVNDVTALEVPLTLKSGGHQRMTPGEWCVMEAAAWIAGEPWSDHPECACPVITAFLVNWNDSLRSDEARTEHLARYLAPASEGGVIGTKASAAVEGRRAWMATDWLIRVQAPAWLRLAGLDDEAAALEALPEVDSTNVSAAMPALEGAKSKAYAARDAAGAAARDAAWAAAGDAAWAAAWAAARAAAWAAAGDAAWAAARDAAWAAAEDAARDAARAAAEDAAGAAAEAAAREKLAPVVPVLQESAHELLGRMIALTDEDVAA